MLFTVFYSSPRCYQIISRLRSGFSHLRKDKFTHNFHDTLNHLYSCSLEPETNLHYLLCCHNFSSTTLALMSDLNLINPTISCLNKTALANILLYGESKKSISENSKILYITIKYIITTKGFDESRNVKPTCTLYVYIYIYIYICIYMYNNV